MSIQARAQWNQAHFQFGFFIPKIESVRSPETSVNFYRTAWDYNPEYDTLRVNLKLVIEYTAMSRALVELYCPPWMDWTASRCEALNIEISGGNTHFAHRWHQRVSALTATSRNCINWLVFVTETQYVYCEVVGYIFFLLMNFELLNNQFGGGVYFIRPLLLLCYMREIWGSSGEEY
jgi:hypothetical protein